MTPDFKSYLEGQNDAAVRLTCILCAALMPAGLALDLFTNRAFVGEFLVLRLLAGGFSLGVLGLSRLRALHRYSYPLIVAVILAEAGLLVVTAAESTDVRPMIETARTLNPQVKVAVRTHSDEEAQWLAAEGARTFAGEDELAQAMLRHVLGTMQAQPA